MAISHRDIWQSIARSFVGTVTTIPVLDATQEVNTESLTSWIDLDVLSFEPQQNQRNSDFEARGTLRARGYYRSQPGQVSKPGQPEPTVDERFRLTQAIQDGLRGKNIQVYDYASGTGATLLGAVLLGEAPCSTLDPTPAVGIILSNVEFLLTTT